jgi:hypothetical protein
MGTAKNVWETYMRVPQAIRLGSGLALFAVMRPNKVLEQDNMNMGIKRISIWAYE